jgi:DNA-binding transcriptional LysR family regulator
MELRHLRYFMAVADELHFRRAAERLHVAQPAVSEQIRKLEQELGVRLFDRTQRSVALTAAGVALRREARHVLRRAEVAAAAATEASQRATMRLRVGYVPDVLPATIPRALRLLTRDAPSVEVDLEIGVALTLLQEVREGELDAAVVGLPAPTSGLRATPIDEQRPVVALPAGHPASASPTVDLAWLAPQRLVVLSREVDPAFHAAVVALCREAGIAPTLREIPAPRVEDVLMAVTAGQGMALLPEAVADRYAMPGVRLLALDDERPAFQVAVVTRPGTEHLATQAFVRAIARARQAALAAHRARTGAVEDRAA